MQCFDRMQQQNNPTCVALGAFDGIHVGHRTIIASMCKYAEQKGLDSAVFTFSGSPAVLLGKSEAKMLTGQPDKMRILEHLGVDKCFSLDFLQIMMMPPTEFIEELLIQKMNVKAVFCGFNYRFGRNALGDTALLEEVCGKHNVEVFVTAPVCLGGSVVSSSRIRELIENGEMALANRLLGRPFSVELDIVEGRHNGRKVGIPTINQTPPGDFVVPKLGVYASFAVFNGKKYEAITNVGVRPTVGKGGLNYETHIIGDFNEELYGQAVRVELLAFVRSERKFNNLSELSEQIKKDIKYIYDNDLYGLGFN